MRTVKQWNSLFPEVVVAHHCGISKKNKTEKKPGHPFIQNGIRIPALGFDLKTSKVL